MRGGRGKERNTQTLWGYYFLQRESPENQGDEVETQIIYEKHI